MRVPGTLRGIVGHLRGNPLAISLLVLVIGAGSMMISLLPGEPPLGGGDVDGDGISDLYEDVRPVTELRGSPEEGWTEVRVGYGSDIDVPLLALVSAALLLVLPTLAYLYFWNRPRREEEKEMGQEEAGMHDTVRRMAAFLEINPSLLSAAIYSYHSMPGGGRRTLGKLLWEARNGGRPFNQVYDGFRREWEKRDGSLGKALGSLKWAERECSIEEVRTHARRAVEDLSEEGKANMGRYVQSLAGPSTALFGLGVLLPVMLATLIPLAGIGGRTTWMVALLLWVVLPLTILHFGSNLVRKRPRFTGTEGENRRPGIRITWPSTVLTVAGTAIIVFSLMEMTIGSGPGPALPWLSERSTLHILLLWGVALLTAGIVKITRSRAEREKEELDGLRRELPGFLQHLGSGIMSGLSFEGSLRRAADSSGGRIRGAFQRSPPIPGRSWRELDLPGPLRGALRTAEEFSRSGARTGGMAIRALSRHLRDLVLLEDELETRIKSAVGQMELTSAVFAPLMLGASVAIFHLMEAASLPDTAADGGMLAISTPGEGAMGESTFILLSGMYLILLSLSTTLSISRMRKGSETGGWKRVPARVVQSVATYSLGVFAGLAVLG